MSQVSYDHRAVTIDGRRTLLASGAIHYPRSTPALWPALMRRSREAIHVLCPRGIILLTLADEVDLRSTDVPVEVSFQVKGQPRRTRATRIAGHRVTRKKKARPQRTALFMPEPSLRYR